MPGIARLESDNAEFAAELFPKLLAAAELDPGHDFLGCHAERYGGKEIEGRGLALPVIFGSVVHIGGAGCDGIKSFKSANNLSGCMNPDFQ